MAKIGIVENNNIVNVIAAESLENAQSIFLDKELVDITNLPYLGLGSFKDNDGKWYPYKENQSSIWSEELQKWSTVEEIYWHEINKTRPHCFENKPCIHYSYNEETKEWYLKSPYIAHPDWAATYPEHLEWLQNRTEVIISDQ